MITQPGSFFNPRGPQVIGGTKSESIVLSNNPQLALALTPFQGYSSRIAKVRRINAADEVIVYSFRDSDEHYLTGSGWQDGSGETFYLVEWYSQKGTNYAYQTVQADQPLLNWGLLDGWYLDLIGTGAIGQYMRSNDDFRAETVFCNFEDAGASSVNSITGSSEVGSHGYLFVRGDTDYYISVDGSVSNQGYVYRNNGAKLGPSFNVGTSEDVMVNQVASIGMTSIVDIDQDLLFAFSASSNGRPDMRCRCLLSYPVALDETTVRADIHDLLMTQYGI